MGNSFEGAADKDDPPAGAKKKRKADAKRPARKHNVLVTGATSTIGRKLCEKLFYDPSIGQIWALSRRELPYYFRDFDPGRFVFQTCAPTNERRLAEICTSEEFAAAKIDTVVHMAFQVGQQGTRTQAHDYNIRGTQNLIDIARETPSIKKFIFLSSAKVYRLPLGHVEVLTEESPLNDDPDAEPYVRDLVEAELLCRQQLKSSKSLKLAVLRPSFVIGRNVHSFYSYYLDSPVCPRIQGQDPLVNLVHSEDVIRAIRLAIAKPVSGVFNIPGKETKSLREYISFAGARTFAVPEFAIEPIWQAVRRLQFNRHPFPFRAQWLKYNCVMSGAKARAELGYEPDHHVKFDET